jgi:hypothetical protein
MANQRGMGKTDLPHFIHATTILYHFAPLSTTCMSIIVQKLGIGKDFLRFYSKNAREILEKRKGRCVKSSRICHGRYIFPLI